MKSSMCYGRRQIAAWLWWSLERKQPQQKPVQSQSFSYPGNQDQYILQNVNQMLHSWINLRSLNPFTSGCRMGGREERDDLYPILRLMNLDWKCKVIGNVTENYLVCLYVCK